MMEAKINDQILLEILGIKHLDEKDILAINNAEIDLSLTRAFEHLAECRLCRKKVRRLTFWDFKRAYPRKYQEDYLLERFNYYSDPDPRPYFDEQVSCKEKLWRLFRYRENHFFDSEKIEDFWNRVKAKFISK